MKTTPIKHFYIIILLLLSIIRVNANGQHIVINNDFEHINIAPKLQIIETTDNISIEKIIQIDSKVWFDRPKDEILRFDKSNRFIILKASFINVNYSKPVVIEITNPNITSGELFIVENHKVFKKYDFGYKYPFDKRNYKNRNFVFEIDFPTNKTTEIYIKIDNRGEPTGVPIEIHSNHHFHNKDVISNILTGCFLGFILLSILISFVMFIWSQQLYFIYYALYLFGIIIWSFTYYGLSYQYLWPTLPDFNVKMVYSLIFGTFITFNLFLNSYLKLKEHHPYLKTIALILNIFWTVIIIGTFLADLYNIPTKSIFINLVYFVVVTEFSFLTFSIFYIMFKRQNIKSLIFAVSFLFFLLGCVVYILQQIELIPSNSITNNSIVIGNIFEILTLTINMSYQVFTLNKKWKLITEENNDHQKNLLLSVIETQEKERTRIARDLHDDLGATLSAVKLNLQSIPAESLPINKIKAFMIAQNSLDKAIESMRSISRNLVPPMIETLGLNDALKQMIDELTNSQKITIIYNNNISNLNQTKEFEKIVFWIIKELINNAIKHSDGTEIKISIDLENNKVIKIIVEDNGKGLPPEIRSNGLGIKNVESRVIFLKGTLNVDSTVSLGTKYIIHIPIAT